MKFFKDGIFVLRQHSDLVSRVLMGIVVIGVLALAIILSGNKNHSTEVVPPTPTPMAAETVTDIVESNSAEDELYADFASTTGVVVAAGSVVLLLLGGIFIEILSNKKEQGDYIP